MKIFSLFLVFSTLNGLSKAGLLHKDETGINEPVDFANSTVLKKGKKFVRIECFQEETHDELNLQKKPKPRSKLPRLSRSGLQSPWLKNLDLGKRFLLQI